MPRLSSTVETTAYFVVAEALTNVAKHAGADRADVKAAMTAEGRLVVTIRDNGRGGALASRGTGLTGLFDRVEASNGTFTLVSPPQEAQPFTSNCRWTAQAKFRAERGLGRMRRGPHRSSEVTQSPSSVRASIRSFYQYRP